MADDVVFNINLYIVIVHECSPVGDRVIAVQILHVTACRK
jgi:hypothetical protein